ncbi:DEAD/DEAH box helicase [Micromonospora lupini]
MSWSPGMSFRAVLDRAPLSYIRDRLGTDLCGLLDLIEGGSADEAKLRAVAASAIDHEQLLAHPNSRTGFLAFLPTSKQAELARRLGLAGEGQDPAAYLQSLKWTLEHRQELLEFLGFTVDRLPTPELLANRSCPSDYGLFPHQRDAAARVRERLYDGVRRVVLHLPTGVGKTRTGMNLICDHLRQHEPTLVVWLAHGQELLEQAAAEFERAWSKLGNRTVDVIRLWGSNTAGLDDVIDGIVVLGLEKAVSSAKRDETFLRRLAAVSSLVVFDEAHQIVAPTYQRVVEDLTISPRASLLGLTATPGRTWADVAKDEELSAFFFRQKVMLRIGGYTNPVTALIDEGYLSRPSMRTVASDTGMHLTDADRHALADSFDIPADIITRLANDEQWNLQVVRTVLDLVERHRRILVFAASVDHCRLIAAVLSALGFDAAFVTGISSPRHRTQVISRFKSGARRPMILCNYGVLTTGFDAPGASAAVIARPTKSLVLYSQMVGRVIRGPKAGGTPDCEIVTVVDPELPGFGDIAEAFVNWEDVWETA